MKDEEALWTSLVKLLFKAFSDSEDSDESASDFLGSSTEELLGELGISSGAHSQKKAHYQSWLSTLAEYNFVS
ncbi:MAG: hypothetical protein DRR16_13635 [Candidatus Parabeggiatoa sp. nov. 3]|nr:MAG: hypothetical protein DRR00_02955 [Gammaproteobacteria bacterium]RKZ69165.1 MAG: hypothetical protein DRQ99_01775 [Gammaproteobacteria bacterium]RKZ84810.1 MAG: hypothetical protein DRR16_13635 [Gammaproteobacteria bacterium]